MFRWLRLAFVLMALSGCERATSAPLLELSGVSPKRVEDGDKLEIEGASLPEGRDARVVFRGALHRPGEAAETLEFETKGHVVARDRIEIAITRAWIAAMSGERRVHTTFEGSVEVVFAAQAQGAPPVSGAIERAEIDVLPDGRLGRDFEAGARTLATLGVHYRAQGEGDAPVIGVEVSSVDPGSRAERAGLAAGDRLVSFAGVRVMSTADIALQPGAGAIDVKVSHGASSNEESVVLDTGGLAPAPKARVALGLLLAALAIAALAAHKGPSARTVSWLERRLGAQHPAARGGGVNVGVAAALIAATLALPLARPVFGARVELPLVVATILIASAALAASRATGPRQLAQAWATEALRALPLIAALATIGLRHGSLTAQDAIRAQGAWPWEWTAAKTPMGAALLTLMLASWVLPSPGDADHRSRRDAAAVFACAVASTALLGGWSNGTSHISFVGVAAFVCKTLTLFVLARRVRHALPAITMRTWGSRVLPLSLAAIAGELACQRLDVSAAAGSITGAVAVALALAIAVRARRISRGQAPRTHASAVL